MNRLSLPGLARRLCLCAALFLPLAGLLGTALAQKTIDVPPPAPAATPTLGQEQKEMLAQDKRLDRPATLDLISVPLGEVLQQQSVDKSTDKMEDGNKFVLTAAPDCADLKMQVRLNKRPLRTLMQAIAEMLPGVWTPTPHGYQLSMTKPAADARAEWWRLFLGEREKALALQRQAVLAAMQTKARRRQIGDPDPEQSNRAIEEEVANQHDFYYSLPPALKEQIAANMEEAAFDEVGRVGFGNSGEQTGTIGWLSQMPPQTQENFKTAVQDYITNHLAPAPPALQGYARQAQQGLAALDPSRVYFLFQNFGVGLMATPFNGPPGANSTLSLDVPETPSLPVMLLDQSRLVGEMYGGRALGPRWKHLADTLREKGEAATSEEKCRIYDVYGMGDAAPDEWKRLAAYQRSRIWPNTLPKLPREDGVWRPQISRAGRMDWLGEQGHMEYVSDYYSQGGYALPADQKKLPVKRPLAKELDEIAARHDVSWTKDADGVYLVRNNRWYRDDGLEVPEPLLRRWFAQELQTRRQEIARRQQATQTKKPALPSSEEQAATQRQMWDWAAEVFGALTPWQVCNGLAKFQPEEKDLAPLNDATAARLFEKLKYEKPQGIAPPDDDAFADATRTPPFFGAISLLKGYPRTARLYGSLDDAGRGALLKGSLPVSALGPSQLTQALTLQPFLPEALQHFPPASVLLRLSSRMRLEVTPPSAPPNAP